MDGAPEPGKPVLIPPTGLTARASTDTIANQDPLVRAALVYINRHLGESFGTPEIAASIGLPLHKLDHLFAKKLGHSVGSEVHDRRIARARRQLSDPAVPVKDVASQCDFCNVAYLSNVFKKAMGLSPAPGAQKTCYHRPHPALSCRK